MGKTQQGAVGGDVVQEGALLFRGVEGGSLRLEALHRFRQERRGALVIIGMEHFYTGQINLEGIISAFGRVVRQVAQNFVHAVLRLRRISGGQGCLSQSGQRIECQIWLTLGTP